jgi:tetratricopeptide (TPR) repeat protein
VERDRELLLLRTAIAEAVQGAGSCVAVAGDAGTGKTTLIDVACRDVTRARVVRSRCDPLPTPRPLGPIRDVAADLDIPALRGREVPLGQVCEEVYQALRSSPTVLVVEDLHWADAASVEVLRFLVRRAAAMPLTVLASYREHVGRAHPVRPLLEDFARVDAVTTLRLAPLTLAGVRQLVAGTALDPDRVHALTGGNPFFVTEVAKEPDLPLPGSVRDAVLARITDVAAEDFEVLQLVATASDGLADRVLPALGIDLPTLRRLDETGLLARSRGGLVFSHELGRQALESTIPPGGSSRLHARLLDALERVEPRDPAVLTHHAVAAHDRARAVGYADAAARDSARSGSHHEAAAFLLTALEHLDADAAPRQRADLLQRLSVEQYMTGRLEEAIANVRATFPLWERGGDAADVSAAHELCSLFELYDAQWQRAEADADRAAHIAGESGCDVPFGTARATRAFLAYMSGDRGLVERCLQDARRVAELDQHAALALRADLIADLTDLAGGEEVRGRIADHVEVARAGGWDELASTGYSQLVHLDVEQRRFAAAERVLEESLPFAVERDILVCRHWQLGIRSRLRFAQSQWDAAHEDATRVLEDRGMAIATLWPSLVSALVPLRRGATDRATSHLEEAWRLAEQVRQPMARLAVLAALAERTWLTGQADVRVTGVAPAELARLAAVPLRHGRPVTWRSG